MPRSLILIPDISGYTKFVNNTEIEHSQHIISELLELIIGSNDLDMIVSEVEGDAVLFVKEGSVPPLKDLILQAKTMFLQFHRHLLQYESERICNCGACSMASNLSLKFIIHASEIGFTFVNQVKKPFGPGLIIAHRLLKNSVTENEYILFSDAFFNDIGSFNASGEQWIKFHEGLSTYDELGVIQYKYILLYGLKEIVPQVEPINLIPRDSNPAVFEGIIQKPADYVFEMLSNLDYRLLWSKSIKELVYDKNRVNRAGTKHICVFSRSKVEFETIKDKSGNNKLVFGERMTDIPVVKDVSFYYILQNAENNTKVRIEIHFHPRSFIGRLLLPLIKMKILRITKNNFNSLKDLCENENQVTD
jgi:hypothetical protein